MRALGKGAVGRPVVRRIFVRRRSVRQIRRGHVLRTYDPRRWRNKRHARHRARSKVPGCVPLRRMFKLLVRVRVRVQVLVRVLVH